MASLKKRGKSYQIQYYSGGKQKRKTLGPVPYQIAKDQLRHFDSARLRGIDNPLPTRTPIAQVVNAYVEQIRLTKTPKSAQIDVYYLREMFGPICPALEITSRKVNGSCRKRPPRKGADARLKLQRIDATCFEAITTAQVAEFITSHVRTRSLAPKTANRYREIIVRLFNWAMKQRGVRMPGDRNPAAPVERYKEPAPEIRYLTHEQIDEQLEALADKRQLQTMVATLIYAGLRREELLWLTLDDVDLPYTAPGVIHVRAKSVCDESWQPKTKTNRSIPVSRALRSFLDGYTPKPMYGSLFFPSPECARWDPDNFSTALRTVNARMGLPWTCLHFRHTFGSVLAQNGVSLYKVSQLLGNSPEVCRRHYAALAPESLSDEVEFRTDGNYSRSAMA